MTLIGALLDNSLQTWCVVHVLMISVIGSHFFSAKGNEKLSKFRFTIISISPRKSAEIASGSGNLSMNRHDFITGAILTETSGAVFIYIQIQTNYMSRIARKGFFGVHATD